MDKIKEKLKKEKKDKAIYAILIAICIIAIAMIGAYIFVQIEQEISTASSRTNGKEDVKNLNPVQNAIDNSEKQNQIGSEEIENKIENNNTIDTSKTNQTTNNKTNTNHTSTGNKINQKNNNKTNSTSNNKTSTTSGGSSSPKYYIKVNYQAQVVTIYTKDDKGKYTKPVKAMVCSTGTHTPKSGIYKIPHKYRWLGLIGNVYGQYCTQVVGNILFHSVPYLKKGDHSSLEYWEYDKLGTKASLGCIRLTCQDAKWIYDNCKTGTQVEFYASSNPGPLGKPSARKISGAPENIRGWDPTDPASNNPWKTYKPGNTDKDTDKDKNDDDNNNSGSENDNTQNNNQNNNTGNDKQEGNDSTATKPDDTKKPEITTPEATKPEEKDDKKDKNSEEAA